MGWSPLTYAVEHAENPGTTLLVRTDRPHPGNWTGGLTSPVLPSSVAAAIQAARAEGWAPEAPGSPFRPGSGVHEWRACGGASGEGCGGRLLGSGQAS